MMILAMMLAAAQPSARAEALGFRLAENGSLAAMLPMIEAKETAELIAAHPELSEADKAALKTTAAATAAIARTRLFAVMGHQYASSLTVRELTSLLGFNASPLARRYRAAEPKAAIAVMQALNGSDFKADTLTAFCAKTGKACSAK